MSGNNLEAQFHALLGVTGCGKTYELKKRLKKLKPNRTLIWSPKERIDQYAELYKGSKVCRSTSEVLEVLRKAGSIKPFRIVYVPTLNQRKDSAMFDVVCKMVMAVGNVCLIAEELHTVTTATHAPDGWRHICFMGRGFGVHVFGLSQRPASVDKAFMGSLSSVHVGRLPNAPDQKTMADIIGVEVAEVAALTGYQAIQKNMQTGELKRQN
jgi:hypothetical protein